MASFNKNMEDNIFFVIQLSGMSYGDIMMMPVNRMYRYIDWKIKYDEEVEKQRQKSLEEIKSRQKSKSKSK